MEQDAASDNGRWLADERYIGAGSMFPTRWTACRSSFRKIAAISRDRGESWTKPAVTDIPDARTKQCAGNLPDGRTYMIGCPVSNKQRWPLVLLLSPDGIMFNQAYLLRSWSDLPPKRYEGKAKTLGYNYPKAIVYDNKLYVSYTTNKEDVVCTVIPIDIITNKQ